jgi:hypothetical protein
LAGGDQKVFAKETACQWLAEIVCSLKDINIKKECAKFGTIWSCAFISLMRHSL